MGLDKDNTLEWLFMNNDHFQNILQTFQLPQPQAQPIQILQFFWQTLVPTKRLTNTEKSF